MISDELVETDLESERLLCLVLERLLGLELERDLEWDLERDLERERSSLRSVTGGSPTSPGSVTNRLSMNSIIAKSSKEVVGETGKEIVWENKVSPTKRRTSFVAFDSDLVVGVMINGR